MFWQKRIGIAIAMLAILALTIPLQGQSNNSKPLSEEDILTLVKLRLKDDVIASKVQEEGVGFAVDAALVERLKKAATSDALLTVVQKAGVAKKQSSNSTLKPVTFEDVLTLIKLKIDEKAILERLSDSPTTFVLDVNNWKS